MMTKTIDDKGRKSAASNSARIRTSISLSPLSSW